MKAANEARVGVVVILALILMVVGYFFLRGLGLATDKYYMRLIGATIVTPGNEVRLQGVKIGQILSVDLNAEQKPILTVAVKHANPPLQLLKSYHYTVLSSALIGENYVDIRGPFRANSAPYPANDPSVLIPTTAAGPLSNVTDQAALVMGDMRVTLTKLNVTLDRINKGVLSYDNQMKLTRALEGVAKLSDRASQTFGPGGVKIGFGDPQTERGLRDTLQNSAAAAHQASLAAGDLRVMAADLRGVVDANKGDVHTLLGSLNKTATEVAGLAESLSFLVKNGGLQENMRATMVSVRRAAENVEAVTGNLKTTLGDTKTQDDLKATVAAARKSAENVEAATGTLKSIADPDTQKNIRAAIASLSETAASLKDTAQGLKNTIGDPASQKQLKDTLASINTASATLAQTMTNLKDSSAGLKNVLGDPKLQADIKALPGDLRASAAELKNTLAAARGTAKSVQDLSDTLGGILPHRRRRPDTGEGGAKTQSSTGGADFPVGASFTYRNLSGFGGKPRVGDDVSGHSYGDIGFDANLFGGPFRLGLSNIGEGTDVTLQTGRYVGKNLALRYGVYRSQLGAGVELRKGHLFVEGNAWNLNNNSYNALAGVRVTPQIELFAGHESIRGVRANELGVRLRQ